jgi:1-acyl-sn-glycerol-3-phosphate acyltransferase
MPKWYHKASWALLRTVYGPSLKRVEISGTSGKGCFPKGPFVLMADHGNALDPYVIGSFSPRPIRYMANIEGVGQALGAFAGLVGAYARRKGVNDIASLRKTLAFARQGESIGIFPEGDRSWDGSSSSLRPGVAKLVKKLGLPLVLARQKGNYLTHPRWAAFPRRGAWEIEFATFDADELARMSEGLVDSIIATSIAKDEIKDALREGRSFEGESLAEGVGRLLWRCPVCGKADCIVGIGNEIRCGRCHSLWTVDANCRVVSRNFHSGLMAAGIADLKDWHDWQAGTLGELADLSPGGLPGLRSEGVILSRRDKRGIERLGVGRLSLRRSARGEEDELVFDSSDARLSFRAADIRGFVDNFNAFSEFDCRGSRWRLEFNGGNAVKWACAFGEGGIAIPARAGSAVGAEGAKSEAGPGGSEAA